MTYGRKHPFFRNKILIPAGRGFFNFFLKKFLREKFQNFLKNFLGKFRKKILNILGITNITTRLRMRDLGLGKPQTLVQLSDEAALEQVYFFF